MMWKVYVSDIGKEAKCTRNFYAQRIREKKPFRVKRLRGKRKACEYGVNLYAGLLGRTVSLWVEGNLSLGFVQGKCIFVSIELSSSSGKRLCLLQFPSNLQHSPSLICMTEGVFRVRNL
jgi:hypothetical protein